MDDYYTVNQVALILKVHPLTIRRYIKEGKLRAIRAGGNVRITLADLNAFTQEFVAPPKTFKNPNNSSNREFSFADSIFKLKARGLNLNKLEQ